MTSLTPERFAEFFSELHKPEDSAKPKPTPFPWQERLVKQILLTGKWPRVVKLPTASGKTALEEIWAYTLAAQATLSPNDRTIPRRMAFVVDRRLIVDEAYKRAEKIVKALETAKSGILREVADALRQLADSDTPLECFQLRGGMYQDDSWAHTPTQPTLITSTVDQIGSRLLFRSYGFVKGFTYPIHAGLTAFDMLIVLDEAHCSNPFYQTAQVIDRYRQWGKVSLPGPFHFVTMTATPPKGTDEPFELDDEDKVHPILSRRLEAPKRTRLIPPVGNAKDEDWQLHALVAELATQAEELGKKGLKAVGIMVNRVATAKAVHAALEAKGHESLLLIGRMRPFDRDLVQHSSHFTQLLADTSEKRQLEKPIFVVATQTLEVGANLDFDGLVSECPSLDALRQRFGRLNRLGRKTPDGEYIKAEGVLVIRADDADTVRRAKDPDPVYGETMAKTWQWLANDLPAIEAKPTKSKGKSGKKPKALKSAKWVDLGITALQPDLDALEDKLAELSQDILDAPVMLPTHIDAWAQTSPAPMPDPDVSIFLHGPQRGAPEVQLVWRADLDATQPNLWVDTVSLCPPTSVEALQAPLYLVKRWLQRQTKEDTELADVEGARLPDVDRDSNERGRKVLLWRGPKKDLKKRKPKPAKSEKKESQVTYDPNDILPGDTVVIPADEGGWEIFGHLLNPATPDIAEAARYQARRKLVYRLHPKLLAYLPAGAARSKLLNAAQSEDKPNCTEIKVAFAELAQTGPEHLRTLFETLASANLKLEEYPSHADGDSAGWVITGKLPNTKPEPLPVTDEDDQLSLNGPKSQPVLLADHVQGVTDFAVRYATQCGLPPELVNDFKLAGQFHDAGKADPRFQAWLYGCMDMNLRYQRGHSKLIAKSEAKSEARKWAAKAESGYPDGSRHELLSVKLIQDNEAIKTQAHDWDLILHLIASHHGRCRPFAPVVDDPTPETVELELYSQTLTGKTCTELEKLDSGVAERFWKLIRKYGWWGLAYLETIFRLADHRQSQKDIG